jgi:hypothetical protein
MPCHHLSSYGLAHSQKDSRRRGFVFNRDQDFMGLHHECRETSRVAWIVPRTASTHELACDGRIGKVKPHS